MKTGISSSVRALLADAVSLIKSRVELARLEVRQARSKGKTILILAVVTLLAALGCYGALLTALITQTAVWLSGNYVMAALVVAGIHLILLALFGWLTWKFLRRKSFFQHTVAELKADKEWLTNLKNSGK